MLAATLAVGSVPAISLVQANLGMEGAPIALAAEGSGYDLEVGKAYVVGATWSNDFNMGANSSVRRRRSSSMEAPMPSR